MHECVICNTCKKDILNQNDPYWTYIDNKPVCRKCYVKDKLRERRMKRLKAVS